MKTTNQVPHYNAFGDMYRDAIINAENPGTWTSDADPASHANIAMKIRIDEQERVVLKYFNKSISVLDLGCGFGRQTYMMAKNNFQVTGVDNSGVFIDIAKALFNRHNLKGEFICASIMDFQDGKKHGQITLFDVVEHFTAEERKQFMKHLAEKICTDKARVVITFPYMNENSIRDRAINIYKSFTSNIEFLSAKKEHPYPIPFRKQFTDVVTPYFNVLDFFPKGDTAYYVLERK
jgi:SAM-dependent methyltransferase